MLRTLVAALIICRVIAQGATYPPPDLTKAQKIGIWATEYHIHRVPADSGPIPLLTLDGKSLGPRLSALDFCNAALEGTVRVGRDTFNVSGAAKAEPQFDCHPIVNRDVGRNRFARAKGAFGDGVDGYQLVPYRTVATDPNKIPPGTLLYIPAVVGRPLPDGSKHDGYFFAADTGEMKDFHIDVFQGLKPVPLGFIHSKSQPVIPAYIVNDDTIRQALTKEHRSQSPALFNRALQASFPADALNDAEFSATVSAVTNLNVGTPSNAASGNVPKPGANPAPSTTTSSTIPEFGKPRGDYVPCLFTTADHFRFKNAVYFAALNSILARQQLIGRLTEAGLKTAKAMVQELKSPTDVAGLVRDLADAGLIQPSNSDNKLLDKALDKAIEAVYKALAAQGVAGDSFDVSCSQSVLTYAETSDIFGKRVANNYVAIQVTVRNLNPDKEFLMHDVQIAVDFEPPAPGVPQDNRFIAGRDKLLVRGVALRGQSDDPRNRFIRIAEAVGDIASASTIGLKALDFRNGVSVFRSAFIPGVKNIFPDYTVDQLNRLNDMAFSANTSYKLVISKNGSSPFVTFIPSKIFADNYKTWSHADLRAFNEKVYVVFAGVHITESNNGQIAASDLSCPADANGFVDLTGSSTTVDCTLKGDNLQSISKVRLRNSNESTDDSQVDADVSSTGTVKFDAAQLKALPGAEYSVFLVDKTGHEITTGLRLKFASTIDSLDAIQIGTAGCDTTTCKVNVTGTRLGNIQRVVIAKDATNTAEGTLDAGKPPNTGTVTFQGLTLAADGDYDISTKVTATDKSVPTGKKIKVSGTTKP